jgi:hypothetical protein
MNPFSYRARQIRHLLEISTDPAEILLLTLELEVNPCPLAGEYCSRSIDAHIRCADGVIPCCFNCMEDVMEGDESCRR